VFWRIEKIERIHTIGDKSDVRGYPDTAAEIETTVFRTAVRFLAPALRRTCCFVRFTRVVWYRRGRECRRRVERGDVLSSGHWETTRGPTMFDTKPPYVICRRPGGKNLEIRDDHLSTYDQRSTGRFGQYRNDGSIIFPVPDWP